MAGLDSAKRAEQPEPPTQKEKLSSGVTEAGRLGSRSPIFDRGSRDGLGRIRMSSRTSGPGDWTQVAALGKMADDVTLNEGEASLSIA